MADEQQIHWPREIWMAEREDHDQGVVSAVLSEHATVARFEGDKERDREFHRYVDGDIYDSAEKYHRARLEAVEKERDLGVAQNDRLWAANHRLVSTADAETERADAAMARAERAEAALALRNGECEAKKIIIAQLEAALATARRDALEEAARVAKVISDQPAGYMGRIERAIRDLKDLTPDEMVLEDARIPDHAAWAARGRWREAYEALVALAEEASS